MLYSVKMDWAKINYNVIIGYSNVIIQNNSMQTTGCMLKYIFTVVSNQYQESEVFSRY